MSITASSLLRRHGGRIAPILIVGAVLALSFLAPRSWFAGNGASFTYSTTVCNSAGISGSPASPQTPGTTVTLTATSTGCSNPEYLFWLLPPGSTAWTAQGSFSSSTTFAWNTTGAAPGVWQIGVWARQVGSTASYQAYSIHTYTLTIAYCTSAEIVATPASPQVAGTPITFTGTAAGCSSPLFEFWELPAGSTNWQIVQAFSPSNTFVWNNTGLANGPYRFGIWAKQNGSPNSYDTFAILTFWIDP